MKSRIILLVIAVLWISAAKGQEGKDTTKVNLLNRIKNKAIAQQALNSFKQSTPQDTLFTTKSEDSFFPYEGKIIRKITLEKLGFDRNVIDTSRTIKSFFVNAGNRLHSESKDWAIRNNLFFSKGSRVNPYRLADNERYLRDLDFILDSRIFVTPIEGSDSVDVLVVTRDVFSLGASVTPSSLSQTQFSISETNLAGMGQKIQLTGLYDNKRNPSFGQDFLYVKNNLFGSFVDGTLGYTTINTGPSEGNESENSYYLRLSRPLFHPFTRWSGALNLSHNASSNVTRKPDTTFARYKYNINDFWIGYSFGHRLMAKNTRENRNRKFFAFRIYDQNFSLFPTVKVPILDRPLYYNRTSLITQVTLFKQDFYKTRYVLGFGRTEDIPYGYRLSYTGGWEYEQTRKRSYSALELYSNRVDKNGAFYTYTGKLASYWNGGNAEDALMLVDFTRYSRIYHLGKFVIRHQEEIGFTQQFNRVLKNGIDIRDNNGIVGFKPDSLMGSKRVLLRNETVVFTQWKLFGFHLAPVTRIDLALLARDKSRIFQKQNFYSGFSLGIRARNENLIFNTVEARVFYFPNTIQGVSNLSIEFRTNIKIKYPTSLVTAPGTVYNP